jgi:hypothetical protein
MTAGDASYCNVSTQQARPSAYPRVHSSSSWRHTSGGAPLGACAGQQRCACGCNNVTLAAGPEQLQPT